MADDDGMLSVCPHRRRSRFWHKGTMVSLVLDWSVVIFLVSHLDPLGRVLMHPALCKGTMVLVRDWSVVICFPPGFPKLRTG